MLKIIILFFSLSFIQVQKKGQVRILELPPLGYIQYLKNGDAFVGSHYKRKIKQYPNKRIFKFDSVYVQINKLEKKLVTSERKAVYEKTGHFQTTYL